jgi:hypothetical protein
MTCLPKILLGCESIVGLATQREIVLRVLAAPREGPQVVELQAVSLGAAPSRVVDVSAARSVALEDSAADRGGDVPTALARVLGVPFDLRGRGAGLRRLALDFRLVPGRGVAGRGLGLGIGFPYRLTVRRRATYVDGPSDARRREAALLRPRRYGVFPPLEFGHERAHRTELDLLERSARCRVREQSPRLLDELDVLLTRGELHRVALR